MRARSFPVAPAMAMLGAILASSGSGQVTAVFGPKRYVRAAGPPQTFVETFPKSGSGQGCRLAAANGDSGGANRTASASISLNGVEIAGPGDFQGRPARIVKPLALAGENRLTVTLTSQPGSVLSIEVECNSASMGEAAVPSQSVRGGGFPHQPLNFPDTVNRPRWTVPIAGMTTFQTNPAGLHIRVDGAEPRAAPFSLALSPGRHTISIANQQAGPEGTRYVFRGWSDGGAATHEIAAGADPVYTATFATQYLLGVSAIPADGGNITVTPLSAGRTGYYDAGAKLTVTAAPAPSYVFSGFTGALTGLANPQTVTLLGPASVSAKFTRR